MTRIVRLIPTLMVLSILIVSAAPGVTASNYLVREPTQIEEVWFDGQVDGLINEILEDPDVVDVEFLSATFHYRGTPNICMELSGENCTVSLSSFVYVYNITWDPEMGIFDDDWTLVRETILTETESSGSQSYDESTYTITSSAVVASEPFAYESVEFSQTWSEWTSIGMPDGDVQEYDSWTENVQSKSEWTFKDRVNDGDWENFESGSEWDNYSTNIEILGQSRITEADGTAHSCMKYRRTVVGEGSYTLSHMSKGGMIAKVEKYSSDGSLDQLWTMTSSTWDSDLDGVLDHKDDFPYDSSESKDTDSDGVGDNSDAFPTDANESTDSDGDGVGDIKDAMPNNANETLDSDGDGVGDNSDAFPLDPSEHSDSDADGVGDNQDAFPNDPTETKDSDGDGVGDNAQSEAAENEAVPGFSAILAVAAIFLCVFPPNRRWD